MGEVERFSGFVRSTFVRVRLEEKDRLRLLVGRQAQIPRVILDASRCWATCGSGRELAPVVSGSAGLCLLCVVVCFVRFAHRRFLH
jgi:hypothetical protein